MIALEISEQFRFAVERPIIELAAKTTLQHLSAPIEADLAIVVTDDDHIRQLNHDYRGIDAPTDVLSFPADFNDPENDVPYLGDVLISYPRAEVQAEAGGHSVNAELQLLVVHGVLHLLGHDHADSQEKAEMWDIQTQVLAELGISHIQINE